MLLTVGAALLNSATLVPTHADAAWLIAGLNAAVAGTAAVGYVALRFRGSVAPEAIVAIVLVAVDAAIVTLGIAHPDLGVVAMGYLLLLPTVVALLIPWRTQIHVTWLATHVAFAVAYGLLGPLPTAGGERSDRIVLLIVAVVVSLYGHLDALRARVLSFMQIARIGALNRRAERAKVRLDRLNVVLAETARTDALTALRNRRSLAEDLLTTRARIGRYHERYGLLLLDLDRFKAINDSAGHIEGDRVLRSIADAIVASIRVEDRAYRFGGEEFLVMARVTEDGQAARAAERIRSAVERLGILNPGNPSGRATTSVGVTVVGADQLEASDDSWILPADEALGRAKAGGRNRVETSLPA